MIMFGKTISLNFQMFPNKDILLMTNFINDWFYSMTNAVQVFFYFYLSKL